jgi:4-diphosphocytidyl-2-C-methyl-D-erythritol kinase
MISWWPAPAKLNLFLHVTGRRSDGYHDLQTVFQLLDWGDRVGLELAPAGEIQRLEGPADIDPEGDLGVRAPCERAAQARPGRASTWTRAYRPGRD